MMGTWYVDFCVDLPGNGARNSSCYLLSTALDFPEEEKMMQQSITSISLVFDNQGINLVGGYARVPRIYTIQINPRNQRDKGLPTLSRSLTRVRSDRYNIFGIFGIKMQSKK